MTTTIIILLLVLIVEAARLALQWWSYKKYGEQRDKWYCTSYEVENIIYPVARDINKLGDVLEWHSERGYEFVGAIEGGISSALGGTFYYLFFTKKKIKNFKED